jgi:protein TonB
MLLGASPAQAQNTGVGDKNKAVTKEKTKDVTEPELVSRIDPQYPADAKSEKVSGEVRLEVTIDSDGSVISVKTLKNPDARLTQAATEAVKQWKYKPALTKAGKPVQVVATVTVNFKLK